MFSTVWACKRTTTYLSEFSREQMLTLAKIGLYWWIEETIVSARRYHLSLRLECPTQYFPLRTELACQKNSPYLSPFSSRRNIEFKEKGTLWLDWRYTRHCWMNSISVRILSVFTPCSPLRTKWECQRTTFYMSAFSSGRNIRFMEIRPILLSWRKTCISWKNTI
jgi:hypothetical protein